MRPLADRSHLALAALPLLMAAFALPLAAAETLDDGRLAVSWFGQDLEFREVDEIDYLWVKPGLSLDGRALRFVAWPEPEFLGGAERDEKDTRLARNMNNDMPEIFSDAFAGAFGNRLSTSLDKGDVKVEGRIVDCSTGSTAAKIIVGFGAGSGNTTIDLKLTDTKSGELLLAIHHRVVSGTTWSTTDSKFGKWVDEMAELGAKKGFEKLYKSGGKVKK